MRANQLNQFTGVGFKLSIGEKDDADIETVYP